jgi:peptidyl-prolyl cis-trans isomerase C
MNRIPVYLLAVVTLGLSSLVFAQRAIAPDVVLASNAKVKVTYEDFLAELARVPAKDRDEFLLNRQRLGKLVEYVLLNKTMAAEAIALGLDKSSKVQAEIKNETMKILVKHRGINLQETAPKVDLERRAREIYLLERERFIVPKKYDTWHVLVDSRSRTKDEAMRRAEEVRKKVRESGASAEIAEQYSDDTSVKKNKGRIGFMAGTELDPAYSKTMQKLQVDEVSEIVESKFGYHVIVLKAVQPESRLSFETVKSDLIAEADTKYQDSIYYAHLAAIQSDSTIKVNVDALESLRPATPDAPILPSSPPASPQVAPTTTPIKK